MDNGVIWRRHSDQVITTGDKVEVAEAKFAPVEVTPAEVPHVQLPVHEQGQTTTAETPTGTDQSGIQLDETPPAATPTEATSSPPPALRRSDRVKKAPNRLDL